MTHVAEKNQASSQKSLGTHSVSKTGLFGQEKKIIFSQLIVKSSQYSTQALRLEIPLTISLSRLLGYNQQNEHIKI